MNVLIPYTNIITLTIKYNQRPHGACDLSTVACNTQLREINHIVIYSILLAPLDIDDSTLDKKRNY